MTFFLFDGICSFLIKNWICFEDWRLLDRKRRSSRGRTDIHDGLIERVFLEIESWDFLATDGTC